MSTALDFANFEGPKLNKEWKPDDQDLIYTALNWLDGEGDADEDCGQQLVERLLAAWQSSLTAAPASAMHPDDLAVDRFAEAMKAKLAKKRAGNPQKETTGMTNEQVKYMVDRFLAWKLPEDFKPDGGISFKPTFNEHTAHPMRHEPSGTNLLGADQAEVMVRYMLEGIPAPHRDQWTPNGDDELPHGFARASTSEQEDDKSVQIGLEICDAVLKWIVAHDLGQWDDEYTVADVTSILDDLWGDEADQPGDPKAAEAVLRSLSAAPASAEPVAWLFELGIRRSDHPTLPPYRWEKHVRLTAPVDGEYTDVRNLTPLYAPATIPIDT